MRKAGRAEEARMRQPKGRQTGWCYGLMTYVVSKGPCRMKSFAPGPRASALLYTSLRLYNACVRVCFRPNDFGDSPLEQIQG